MSDRMMVTVNSPLTAGAWDAATGAPGFLEYLESSGRYRTQLLKAKYEYEQAWNPDWEPNKEDAMSVSLCLDGGLYQQQRHPL
jgi:hypothetical protein